MSIWISIPYTIQLACFGGKCKARRVPVYVTIMGDADIATLLGRQASAHLDDVTILIGPGPCDVDFLFDIDAGQQLKSPLLGVGGGVYRNGGLCLSGGRLGKVAYFVQR